MAAPFMRAAVSRSQRTYRRVLRSLLSRTAGERRRDGITRHAMYRRLRQSVPRPDGTVRVLSISRSRRLVHRLGLGNAEVIEANYPEHDLLNLTKIENDSFDYLVADQVLEHVAGSPFRAASESLRVVRPGGLVIHTTCFINPIHHKPHDYWRFTPHAMRLLFSNAEILDVGGWGNRAILRYISLGMRREKVPKRTWHPLHRAAVLNESDWPIVTWVVARKRTDA